MTELVRVLYVIVTSLSAPVIIALLLLAAWVLIETGKIIREANDRRNTMKIWRKYIFSITAKNKSREALQNDFFSLKKTPWLVKLFTVGVESNPSDRSLVGLVMSDIEAKVRKTTDRMKLGIRIAPILGLMGTLIPMGPALKGLTTGSIEVVSEKLFIAFSTTVVGLFLGGICYLFFTIKKNWYVKDLTDIDFIIENVFPDEEIENDKNELNNINVQLRQAYNEN